MTIGNTRELDGKLIAVIGGTGFLGTHLAQHLLARGARLRIGSRRPEKAFAIKPLGNLGSVQVVAVNVTKPDSVRVALTGVDAVVNLVGAFAGDLDAVQGAGAGRVAAMARDAGAQAFVQVSAIGADAQSPVAYARTKAAGEEVVLAAFPGAVVVRPSILFGSDDHFLTMFAGLMGMPVLPVFAPGAQLQPLDVDDAARAIGNVLAARGAHAGKTFEIAGPEVMTMLDLNQRIARATQRSPLFIGLPDGVSKLIAALPLTPISSDQLSLLLKGNVASGALPGLRELGVQPRPLDLLLERWLVTYRKHGRFGTHAGANT